MSGHWFGAQITGPFCLFAGRWRLMVIPTENAR